MFGFRKRVTADQAAQVYLDAALKAVTQTADPWLHHFVDAMTRWGFSKERVHEVLRGKECAGLYLSAQCALGIIPIMLIRLTPTGGK